MSTQTFTPGFTYCNHEICDGNQDDPNYAYCDLEPFHTGDHHYAS